MRDGDESSHVLVPPAFVALYLAPGRLKPTRPAAEIAQRHEFCEDLAQSLVEPAQLHLWQLGLAEDVVLERMQRGLAAGDIGLAPAEAGWVLGRLAELLGWPLPSAPAPASEP